MDASNSTSGRISPFYNPSQDSSEEGEPINADNLRMVWERTVPIPSCSTESSKKSSGGDVFKPSFLLMPVNYEMQIYNDDGYDTLIANIEFSANFFQRYFPRPLIQSKFS